METKGVLVVLTGITGSGKDSILNELLGSRENTAKIITTLTRPKREGEVNGENHFFIDKETFLKQREEGVFIETNEYDNNWYGTAKSQLERIENGQDLIWRIDPSTAIRIKDLLKVYNRDLSDRTIVISIDVSDLAQVKQRLRERGMIEESINQRLSQDIPFRDQFENKVINDNSKLNEAVGKVINLIDSFKASLV